jgi:hypothetical protein
MHSLTFTLGGGYWSDLHFGHFTPEKRPPRYPLDRRLGGLQSRSGRGVKEKYFQPSPGIEPRLSDRPARSQSLLRLNYFGSRSKTEIF